MKQRIKMQSQIGLALLSAGKQNYIEVPKINNLAAWHIMQKNLVTSLFFTSMTQAIIIGGVKGFYLENATTVPASPLMNNTGGRSGIAGNLS